MWEGSAEAKVRAGFMLNPDNGDSKITSATISAPAAQPVTRENCAEFETFRMTNIMTNAMTVSATNATAKPSAPGTVAMKLTGTCANALPRRTHASITPKQPPMHCAAT